MPNDREPLVPGAKDSFTGHDVSCHVAKSGGWGDCTCSQKGAGRQVAAKDGWTPLEFYAFIVRSVGLPASFRFDGEQWVGDGPFTKPVPQSILDLLEAQGV